MKKIVLHRVREGAGPVVVLSHALGADLSMWDGVAALLKSDFTVLRYDHRGHGASGVAAGPCTMEMLADDAAALIAEEGGGPVHFVGLSMGGMTAQALAARHPQQVASVVIANSANWYDDAARAMWQARIDTVREKGVAAIAGGAMERWFTPAFRADAAGAPQVARLRAMLERTDAEAYFASCEAVSGIDLRSSNARIACPALVIAGTLDEATPPAQSMDVASRIAGAQLRTLDAAHLSAVEQPAAFAALLREFWAGV
jgi:3-oxoadipate enol-lactonase